MKLIEVEIMFRKKIILTLSLAIMLMSLTTNTYADTVGITDSKDCNLETELMELNKQAEMLESLEESKESRGRRSRRRTKLLDASDIEAGDIIVTDGANWGLTGHAGIAISSKYIIHTPGKNTNDDDDQDTVQKIRITDFIRKYDSESFIKVYRFKDDEDLAEEAAEWAEEFY